MKKIISFIMMCCLLLTISTPNVVFASISENEPDWEDVYLSDEEFDEILSFNQNNNVSTCATGLINVYAIGVSKNGEALIIAGKTIGSSDVKKCGFSVLTIQRRTGAGDTWKNYLTYKDIYNDYNVYNLGKTINLPSGYQYRVTCTHYAKKNILSVEKIDNVSNAVTF